MNNNEGKIWYGLGIDTTDIQRDAQRASNSLKGIGDKAEAEGSRIDNTMKRVGGAVAAAFTIQQASNFIRQVATIRGEFQQLEIAFTTMLKSKEKADTLMKEIVTFAAITPFDLKGVASGAKQLLAYGFAAEDMTKNLTMLGNVSAGIGAQIGDIIYLYGTLKASGRVATMDLRQFAGRGIPIYKELAEVMKTTEKGVMELATKGKIAFEDVEKAFQGMVSEQGMFYNLMEEQSKSITGQIANLGDAVDTMFNEIGESQQGLISGVIQSGSYLVENYKEVGVIIGSLIAVYGVYKASLIAFAAIQAANITLSKGWTVAELAKFKALVLVEGAQKVLNKTMLANPYIAVATALASIIAAMVIYSRTVDRIKTQEELLDDVRNNSEKNIKKEVSELERLKKILNDSSKSYDERKDALDRIKAIVPEYHASLSAEGVLINNNSDALDTYVQKLRITEQMKYAIAKQSEAQDKRDEYKETAENAGGALSKALQKYYAGIENQMTIGERTAFATYKKLNDEVFKYEEVILSLNTQLSEVSANKTPPLKTDPELTDEEKKAAEERKKLLAEIAKDELTQLRKDEDLIFQARQSKIDATKQSTDKELEQLKLNHDKKLIEIDRQQQDLLIITQDNAEKVWKANGSKGAKPTVSLTGTQLSAFGSLRDNENAEYLKSVGEVYKELKDKYLNYTQQREAIEKKFQDDIKTFEKQKKQPGANSEEIDSSIKVAREQQKKELDALDLEIANKSEVFQVWVSKITTMGLKELVNALQTAKDTLSTSNLTDDEKAVLRAKIESLQSQIKMVQASDPSDSKSWKDTLKTMNEVNESVKNIISGFDGLDEATKSILTAATNISGAVISSITGIMALSVAGTEAIKGVERASVILAIIGAAISVVTTIINLYTSAAKKRKQEEEAAIERQRQEYLGLLDYNAELRNKYEWTKKIGEAELGYIKRKGEELAKQKQANEDEQADLYAKLQKETYLSGYETKENFGIIYFGKPQAGDPGTYQKEVWSTLAGKTFEEISELAAQGKLSEEAKKYYEYLKKAKEEGADIEKMQLEYLQMLKEIATGTTAQTITDSIIDGFKAGKRSAADFAETFEQLMQGAVESALKQMTDKDVLAFYEEFAKLSADGLTQAEIESLRAKWEKLISDSEKKAADMESVTGVKFGESASREASAKGFATMSQDSANELNGRFTALQGLTSNISDSVKMLQVNSAQSLKHLAGIEMNTARLEKIESTMLSVKSGIDSINDKGILIR